MKFIGTNTGIKLLKTVTKITRNIRVIFVSLDKEKINIMHIKHIRFFVFTIVFSVLFCAIPIYVFGQVVITEIMYDIIGIDTGREWIEVQNTGTEQVDLSTWKLFESNVSHKITANSELILNPNEFAIIADNTAKFLVDNTGFSGKLFDSTFSLSSAGEILSLRDPEGNDIDSVTYSPEWGAKGNGFSLQKTSENKWIEATPTIGKETTLLQSEIIMIENQGETKTESKTDNTTGTTATNTYVSQISAQGNQAIENILPDNKELEVTSGRERLGIVGSLLTFEAKIKKSNVSTSTISYTWSFGDGLSAFGKKASHSYVFPGDYTVILKASVSETTAVSRVSVHIVSPKLSIISAPEGRVDIENSSDVEINLGGMSLVFGNKKIWIAEDTLINAHGKLTIPFTMLTIENSLYGFDVISPVQLVDVRGVILSSIIPLFYGPYIELPDGMDKDSLKELLMSVLGVSK